MKTKLIAALLLIINCQLSIINCSAQQCCDVPGWQYVVQVDIDNTYAGNTAHANYQVLMQVNTQTPISQNKMNASGSDIRFTTTNCGPFLDYFIESGINTATTNIWVMVPNLPANSVTSLFMYYGNAGAAAMSNFNTLFPSNYILNAAVSLTGVQTYDWIEIQAGGTINLGSGAPLTLNARRIIIAGTINGNNLGFGPGAGPGAGQNGGGSRGGGGGGYGGIGGSGGCGGGNSGAANGTANGPDINMGSGGGNSDCNSNVSGGGAVTLQATEIDITGTINMNGGSMAGSCNEEAAGAGSGGGIMVTADYINGAGAMNARGGTGQNSSNKEGGGGGGGGRIKLFYCQSNNYTGTTNVSKGPPGNGGQCSANDGADGTSTVNTTTCMNITFGAEAPIRIMPVAAFTAPNVCLGNPTAFTDASTIAAGAIITNWSWDFADASPLATAQNPSHTYATANTFQVTLSITSSEGCVATVSQPVDVYPAPVADFTFISQCDGTAIPFTDASTVALPQNIVSWGWDFNSDLSPDDFTQNPTHTFAGPGNYTVGLGVMTDMGCTGTVIHPVTVSPNPVADFTATTVCEGLATAFTDASTGVPVSWSWDFGDGSALVTTQNPTYTYPATGTYSVILTIIDANGCQNTVTKPVTVFPPPVADFTSVPACETFPATFTDISTVPNPHTVTGWLWDFGDGSSTASTQNPTHTYATANTYTVTLTATSDVGCTNTITHPITVFLAPTVDFTFTDDCENVAITFTDISTIIAPSTITNRSWDFDDGSALGTNAMEQHTYTADGVFNVNITVTTSDGCMASIAHAVTVFPEPVAAFTVVPVCDGIPSDFLDASTIASGNITTYDWDFGGGNTSVQQNPQFTFTTVPGTSAYPVTLDVTSNNGCISTVTNNAIVNPNPTANFAMNPATGCAGDLIVFADNSIAPAGGIISVYDYDFNDGVPASHGNTANPSFTYTTANTYNPTLTVTSNQGCTDVITYSITINPIPVADFTADMVCLGIATTFTDASTTASGIISTWNWDFGDGSPTTSQTNPTHTFATDGTHSVTLTVTSDASCSATVTKDVTVYPVPIPSFSSIPVCEGNPTSFTGTSTINAPGTITTFDWDYGDACLVLK